MADIYEKINEYRKLGKDLVLVTVTEKEGMGPADVGKKMLVTQDNEAFGTVGGGAIEFYAREKCKEVVKMRKSFSEKYLLCGREVYVDEKEVVLPMACGGRATLFYEFVGPKQYVYIFGAGHCGAALARILKPLGFHTTIIDERQVVIDALDDSADIKICQGFVDYINVNGLPDGRYIVVATPSHTNDYHVLNAIIEKNIKPTYFGMLCSKKKIGEYMNEAYKRFGKDIDLEKFYSPIGLDIGGNSPEEIAISIAGEILSVFYEKQDINSHLRNTLLPENQYWKH
ncbi:MAG TPA: XdhC/CoxI family protein [Bacilli bacterium]|nr:XdhC/CoxI family protein [Bacilli bacterium]